MTYSIIGILATVILIINNRDVLLWTRNVIVYLGNKKDFGKFLYYAGILFLCFEVVVICQLFYPDSLKGNI